MANPFKVVVVGIGGVGGYFGGLLAKKYAGSPEVDIVFIARKEHLNHIRQHGLRIIKGNETIVATPALATDNLDEVGKADLVLLCTKSYDLEDTLEQIRPCIGTNTLLLPLLNGVDADERIKAILPDAAVLKGCVYIVSRLKEPGTVVNLGNIQTLYFGQDHAADERLLSLERLFKQASIEATLSDNISVVQWEKFIFISPIATATTCFNSTIGAVMANQEAEVRELIEEARQIAQAEGIAVDPDIHEKTLQKLKTLPFEATSSMHSEFRSGRKRTELASLTEYVVRAGKRWGIPTPAYSRMYESIVRQYGLEMA